MNSPRSVRRGRPTEGLCVAIALLVASAAVLVIGACSPNRVRVDLTPVSSTPTGVHNVGQFVWHDLVTDDMDQAKRFYGGLFGWQFEDVVGDPVL